MITQSQLGLLIAAQQGNTSYKGHDALVWRDGVLAALAASWCLKEADVFDALTAAATEDHEDCDEDRLRLCLYRRMAAREIRVTTVAGGGGIS